MTKVDPNNDSSPWNMKPLADGYSPFGAKPNTTEILTKGTQGSDPGAQWLIYVTPCGAYRYTIDSRVVTRPS
jgi:hypothetical protein